MKRARRHTHLRNPDEKKRGVEDLAPGDVNSSESSRGSQNISARAVSGSEIRKPTAATGEERVFRSSLDNLEADNPAIVYPSVPLNYLYGALAVSSIALIWSFWPTWASLLTSWENEPDYSHGWFVIPITAYLLWNFRESMPPVQSTLHWGGVVMLAAVLLLRAGARWAYFDFVDGWMIPLTAIGLAWAFGGRQFAWWALPSLCFLFFMIPLPFRIEHELSRPLQWIATNASCFVLQTLGQPAIAEGTTILLGENTLEVEQACSGLRIFMGVFALSYICALLMRRSWWEGVLLVLASIPIALISNAARIVATGLCYQWFSGESARSFAHDFSGYVMIFFAAGLFGLTLWYLRWLIQDAITMDQASLKRV
jgi:exosortase